jgi:hypothetical protein
MDNRNSESRSPKSLKVLNIARKSVAAIATVVLVPLAMLTFFVVPAPNSQTATEVSGKLKRMSQPLLNSDDLQIKLDDVDILTCLKAR